MSATPNPGASALVPPDPRDRRKWLALQVLTLARIPLAIVFAGLIATVDRTVVPLLISFLVLGAAELTDLLDGILARYLGLVSEWGAMLDPFADSFSRLIIYWGLAAGGLVLWHVPLVMALRDVAVAYSRIVLTRHGASVKANWSGKIKAGVQSGGAMLAVWWPLYHDAVGDWSYLFISWGVMIATAASVVEYVVTAVRVSRAA